MQGDFEKKIRQKMKAFHLTPSRQVWEDIASGLNERKKRKAVGWWIPAMLVILTTGSVLFFSTSEFAFVKQKTQEVAPVKKSAQNETLSSVASTEVKKNQSSIEPKVKESSGNVNQLNASFTNDIQEQNNSSLSEHNDETPTPIALNETPSLSFNGGELIPLHHDNFNGADDPSPNEPLGLRNKSLVEIDIKNAFEGIGLPTLSKPKISKSRFSVFLGGGSTNTTDKNVLQYKTNNLIYHPRPTANNPNPKPDTLKYLRKSYSGYHFSFGLQYQKLLSPRWSFYSGLHYSYLSNTQRIGPKTMRSLAISQSLDTSFSANRSFIKVPYHYIDGTNAVVRNYGHWVELPISFGYTINPDAKNKVEVRTGVTAAYMFSYRWLIADGRYSKFYYSGSLTTERIFNWHGDVALTLPGSLTLGLQMKHSITPLAKKPVQPSLYWSNFSVYSTIPLHK